MYLSQETTEMYPRAEDTVERPFHTQLLQLKRQCQFSDFLRQELRACRTETERGVVLSALAKSRARMVQIARGLNLLEGKPRVSIVSEACVSR